MHLFNPHVISIAPGDEILTLDEPKPTSFLPGIFRSKTSGSGLVSVRFDPTTGEGEVTQPSGLGAIFRGTIEKLKP